MYVCVPVSYSAIDIKQDDVQQFNILIRSNNNKTILY